MKKKIYLLTVIFVTTFLLSSNLQAQYCGNSGSTICTPGGPYPALGFYPPYDSTPCVQIGIPYQHKLDMQIPQTVNYLGSPRTLNYVKVNYITNLPCGLCWSTDVANNQFAGNSTHCVRITGTSYDAPGQYKLNINIDAQATIGGFPFTLSNQNADDFGVKFWARIENLDGTCIIVDTLATGNTAHTAGTAPAPTITGASTVCSGATTSLGISGGTYYGYKWSTGASTATITAGAGTYTVTVYANCASATATKTITTTTVSATATANGPVTFCQGGSVTLNAGAGFSNYAWSNGGGSNQTATYSASGNYTCTVTQGGCTGTTNTVTVTVNNNPTPTVTANGPLTFCGGSSVTLDAGAGYDTYAWSNSAGSNQTATVNASGVYNVTVTQNGCTGTSNNTSVTVNDPTPTVTANGPTTFCAGGSVTLDAGAGYDTYTWSNGGGSNQTATYAASGNYTCTVTLGGCSATSNTVTVTVASSLAPTITASNGLNLCAGGSTTLDAGAGYASYAWSNSGAVQTTSVNSAATYTVTVTQGACNGTAAVTVNVGSFPVTVNLTPANPSGCVGDVITLDAGAGHVSYAWSSGSTSQTEDISATTTPTVTVTDANACTGTASTTVTLNAIPTPTPTPAGNQAVCSGGSLTLDAGVGYSSYVWSNGDNTQTTTVSSADSYTVTVTQNGCTGSSANPIVVSVTALPTPSITPSGVQNICSGQEVTFDAGSGYSAYLWSNGATTQTITVDSTATYSVTVTQNNCPGGAANPSTLFVNLTPNATVSQLGTADGLAVLQASPANATYEWLFQAQPNGAYTAEGVTTSTDTVTCGDVGEYHSVIVTQNGCVDTSDAFVVVCAGINNISSLMSFSVQPNPANDVLNVVYELNNQTLAQISVIDLTGRKVMDVLNEMQSKGTHLQTISLSNLANGIYLLNFVTDKGHFNTKFVKQ